MIDIGTDKGRAMMDAMVKLQAQIIAFSHDYQMVMIFTLCAIPLTIMIGSSKATLRKQSAGAGTCGDRVGAVATLSPRCRTGESIEGRCCARQAARSDRAARRLSLRQAHELIPMRCRTNQSSSSRRFLTPMFHPLGESCGISAIGLRARIGRLSNRCTMALA